MDTLDLIKRSQSGDKEASLSGVSSEDLQTVDMKWMIFFRLEA